MGHMSINHRGLQADMPQQFLDSANIISIFQHMRSKTVAECVDRYSLGDVSRGSALFDRFLKHAAGSMMASQYIGPWIDGQIC